MRAWWALSNEPQHQAANSRSQRAPSLRPAVRVPEHACAYAHAAGAARTPQARRSLLHRHVADDAHHARRAHAALLTCMHACNAGMHAPYRRRHALPRSQRQLWFVVRASGSAPAAAAAAPRRPPRRSTSHAAPRRAAASAASAARATSAATAPPSPAKPGKRRTARRRRRGGSDSSWRTVAHTRSSSRSTAASAARSARAKAARSRCARKSCAVMRSVAGAGSVAKLSRVRAAGAPDAAHAMRRRRVRWGGRQRLLTTRTCFCSSSGVQRQQLRAWHHARLQARIAHQIQLWRRHTGVRVRRQSRGCVRRAQKRAEGGRTLHAPCRWCLCRE
jgi:hypothetical protein